VTSIAAQERAQLCALAEHVGPEAPTLCGGWTVKQLVVHLVLREGSPAAVGIVVKPLSGLLDRASRRRGREDFDSLLRRLRSGPPVYSPMAIPKVDAVLNLVEFFVHHEDIRRAQPNWQPRSLAPGIENALWKALRHAGRGPVAGTGVGVVVERPDTEERVRLKRAEREVVVRGLPSEATLYLYGRKAQSRVELHGEPDDVAMLAEAPLGI
jgi:uncharacterized protein (TIGR03085 family)